MKKTALVLLQIAVLSLISQIGYLSAAEWNVPMPGNLIGMLLLLALLLTGIVKLEWIESGAALLLTHLAFFFVPIAVGLMNFGGLLQHQGIALLATLVIAAGAGIVLAGVITQTLARRAQRTVGAEL
jgi:holin-like protein